MAITTEKILGSAIFIVCMFALQGFSGLLELDRQQVLSGEVWRIWTGHIVHTNLIHFLLNIIAALFIYFAFFTKFKVVDLLAFGFIFSPLISLALLNIYPELVWYNGLSGLLHAYAAFYSIRMIRDGEKVFWLGLSLVWLKVLIETLSAYMGNENLMGSMIVLIEAHLIGASIGTLVAIVGIAFPSDSGRFEPGRTETQKI